MRHTAPTILAARGRSPQHRPTKPTQHMQDAISMIITTIPVFCVCVGGCVGVCVGGDMGVVVCVCVWVGVGVGVRL